MFERWTMEADTVSFCSDSASEDGRYAWTEMHVRLPMALPETADKLLVANFLSTAVFRMCVCKQMPPFVRVPTVFIGFLGAPQKGNIHTL